MSEENFDNSFQLQLATQSWPLYGIGMFIILLRTYARWRRAGRFSNLAPDDWMMMTAVPAFYTMLIVCLNVIAAGGGSNLYPPELFGTFTAEDIQERIKGSKIVVISEQAMLNVIWCIKACMLFMYMRMTNGTHHIRWVKYLAIYVCLGWVAVEIAFFTACRPFKGYWAMPPPDPQCTTLEHYAMIQAVFNISSDFGMLLIPIPMLTSLILPLKQKIVLGIVFSMGIFVIIAAILTKVYNLSDVYSPTYMLWYVREASVAVYVANLPGIWPLLREHVRFLRNHTSYPHGSTGLPQYGNTSGVHRSRKNHASQMGTDIPLGRKSFSRSVTRSRHGSDEDKLPHYTRRGSPASDERALNSESSINGGWSKMNLEVHVDKTIEVQRQSWDASMGSDRREDWDTETEGPKVKIAGPEGK